MTSVLLAPLALLALVFAFIGLLFLPILIAAVIRCIPLAIAIVLAFALLRACF